MEMERWKVYRKTMGFLFVVVFLSNCVWAEPLVLIGGDTGNGNFQALDPFVASRGNRTLDIMRNDMGRRLVSQTPTDVRLHFPGWKVKRTYYGGGNGSWGLDGKGLRTAPGWPNTYFFINSGDVNLESESRTTVLPAGSEITVSFEIISETFHFTPASCAGAVEFDNGEVFEWSAAEASVSAAGTLKKIRMHHILEHDAAQAKLVLNLSTGRGKDGDPASSANQTLLDNIILSVRTEGASLGLLCM